MKSHQVNSLCLGVVCTNHVSEHCITSGAVNNQQTSSATHAVARSLCAGRDPCAGTARSGRGRAGRPADQATEAHFSRGQSSGRRFARAVQDAGLECALPRSRILQINGISAAKLLVTVVSFGGEVLVVASSPSGSQSSARLSVRSS